MNKVILKAAGVTFLWLVVGTGYLLGVFAMCAPKVMAELTQNLGCKNLSLIYSERVYNGDKTAQNLYVTLNKAIFNADNKKIIKYAEEFLKIEHYDEIISNLDAELEHKAIDSGKPTATQNYFIANFCNEEDRITSSYIKALIAEGQNDEAVTVLERVLSNVKVSRPNYAYFAFDNVPNAKTIFQEYFIAYKESYNNTSFGVTNANVKIKADAFIAFVNAR